MECYKRSVSSCSVTFIRKCQFKEAGSWKGAMKQRIMIHSLFRRQEVLDYMKSHSYL